MRPEVRTIREEIEATGMADGVYARVVDAFPIWEFRQEVYKRLDIQEGDTVLDIGGHIGLFARYALSRGAREVISVEPQPESADLLRKNVKGLPVEVIEGAIGVDKIYTYSRPSSTSFRHGNGAGKGWTGYDVMRYEMPMLLEWAQPNSMKMDIEGSEWNILEADPDLEPVRALGIEFHFWDGEDLSLARQARVFAEMSERWDGHLPTPYGQKRPVTAFLKKRQKGES